MRRPSRRVVANAVGRPKLGPVTSARLWFGALSATVLGTCIVAGITGGLNGAVNSITINATAPIPYPHSVTANIVNNCVTGLISGFMGGFLGVITYYRKARKRRAALAAQTVATERNAEPRTSGARWEDDSNAGAPS